MAGARLASHHFPGAPAAVPAGPPRCSDQWEAALAGMPKYGHPGDEVTQAAGGSTTFWAPVPAAGK